MHLFVFTGISNYVSDDYCKLDLWNDLQDLAEQVLPLDVDFVKGDSLLSQCSTSTSQQKVNNLKTKYKETLRNVRF